MYFVHVIAINDPLNSPLDALPTLTAEQLWRGLLRRAERPMDFLPQLKGCFIVTLNDNTLLRELDFGAFNVRDRVYLTPQLQLVFDIEPTSTIPASRLSIFIEQQSKRLQLRFTYETRREQTDDAEMEARYDSYIQSAYVQTDVECVKLIRSLAASGAL